MEGGEWYANGPANVLLGHRDPVANVNVIGRVELHRKGQGLRGFLAQDADFGKAGQLSHVILMPLINSMAGIIPFEHYQDWIGWHG